MFFGGGGGGGRRKGNDAQVEIEVTLEELYNGGQRQARISRNVICPKCRGTGAKDGEQTTCTKCGGRGVRMVQQQMAPGFVVQMQEQCDACGGKGKMFKSKCPHCHGEAPRLASARVVLRSRTMLPLTACAPPFSTNDRRREDCAEREDAHRAHRARHAVERRDPL
jgi:DnaJ-class molecular chaperone